MHSHRPKLPPLGKIDFDFFDKIIFPRLGAADPNVILGPRHGVDFGVLRVGDHILVFSSDPVFIQPSLGWGRAAWFALHILASDVAVSGIPPSHLTIDLNLPPEMDEQVLEIIWETIHNEAARLGIAIVAGHTARYAGCSYPMVGGATMCGVGRPAQLADPRNVRPGDLVLISKGPAVETTGLMAVQFPEFIEKALGPAAVIKAQEIFYQMSVVKDARIASEVGGVVAMHDATECGVLGGLFEMAVAGNYGLRVHKERIVVQEIVHQTCAVFDIDPYKAISEGTLIAVVRKEKADQIVAALQEAGIVSSIVGEVVPAEEGLILFDHGVAFPLQHPRVDPFWTRFQEYLAMQTQKQAEKVQRPG
ncbi:MAG: AIR synthase family protein [Candidatus Oleimicrobiaceae bacterium]